ncbi:MAG: MBL fold metallo-hydrolase [Tannerella sp.]|jgi:glyoxylase-like metal-dependent hydrolase (beta-lactamase superfamily II)|nr:MBL fold metallo-hydrolase [Tannerella sp.]
MHIKRIRIDFKVTEEIRRFVYLYVIVSKGIHLIDTGVAGAETVIEDYLKSIGRNISEVKSILLTHSHPDHIGSAFKIKELSNCTVYACEMEKSWIENIDRQFTERPIPNFYTLLNQSVSIDKMLKNNDILTLEEGITVQVIETKGHSAGSLSFLWKEQGELFTGDAIPATNDIPIYVSARDSIATLQKLLALEGVERYLSAWDDVYDTDRGKSVIKNSIDYLLRIDDTVKNILTNSGDKDQDKIYGQVCAALNLQNPLPLFKASVFANVREAQRIN